MGHLGWRLCILMFGAIDGFLCCLEHIRNLELGDGSMSCELGAIAHRGSPRPGPIRIDRTRA